MLATAIAIVVDDPSAGPVFSQERIGRNGKPFKFYKFRSMCPNAEAKLDDLLDQNEMDGPVFKIKDDPRITRVGKFIRKTSLDELPQLWNILKGDMSIVGPRPALPREVEQYGDYEKQRLYVTPGLSCYWQIAPHRNDLSFEEWMDLDVKYVKERSFWVDYGADLTLSKLADDDEKLMNWYKEKGLSKKDYYLVVGRFVPENSFEVMIREFMKSGCKKDFALITNVNDKFLNELEEKLHFKSDKRIKFVGTVYDQEKVTIILEIDHTVSLVQQISQLKCKDSCIPQCALSQILLSSSDIRLFLELFNFADVFAAFRNDIAILLARISRLNAHQRQVCVALFSQFLQSFNCFVVCIVHIRINRADNNCLIRSDIQFIVKIRCCQASKQARY